MNPEEIIQQQQAAVKAYQSKDLDAAEAICIQILSVNPKEPNALHLLGCIYKDRGNLQQAFDLIQASIREDDSTPIPFINLGNILVMVGQHEEAARIFQQSLQRNQQIPESWFCFGNALREIGNVQEAKQAYRNTLQLNAAHAGAASILGALLADEEKLDESEEIFSKAIEASPQDVNLRINYGKLLEDKYEYNAALEQYRFALLLAPESPELHLNFASALKKEGKVEEAIASCRNAIELRPDFEAAYFGLGIVLKENGEFEEAKASYRKAIDLKPDFADAYLNLGNILKENGEFEEAKASYRTAIDLKPDFADAYLNLGNILKEEGDVEEAIASYRKAIELKPDFADAYLNLGNILKDKGDVGQAIASYRKAIDLKPDFSEAYYQLFLVNSHSGDHDSALIALKQCLDVDDNHYNARQSIGHAFFQADRREEAIQYFSSRANEFNLVDYVQLFRALEGRVPDKVLEGVNPKSNLIEEILLIIEASEIVAFGDSHVNAFKGIPGVSVNYVGPATAFKLASEKSSSGGGSRVEEKLVGLDSDSSAILLCFGEIDCRAHIVKQAYLQQKSIKEVATNSAQAYFDFVLKIKNKGFPVIVCGPYGSGSQFNSFGLEEHRNFAAKHFNDCLNECCLRYGIYFFSLHRLLVDPGLLETRRKWLTDDVHLPEEGDLSDQIKTLLLSQLLLNIQSRHQDLKSYPVELDELCIRDVQAFGVYRENKLPLVYARLSVHGLLQWQSNVNECIIRISFDLGSSVVLDRAIITLKSEASVSPVMEFEIDGCQINALQAVVFDERRIVVDFAKESIGRFLTFVGDADLSDISSVSFIPVSLKFQ
ncbi:TPR repeat:HAT (Half-A-TPR) repeat [Prochlorococcus marinus str. MIT 9313]|uniref:TPR repeat:HAT (Half-A-TPR) repeat n=1 Tax=Prochlorococcus marinus (strain MIT 9313) TaxID=74547 RepID=Q7V4X4_PROMM|nr:tetratricopeptide repeat protein [Prochlorococcus marinus]CAE21986.1 TPR repeat:HAT (Half-A-TPR) repeat [Prochlorococcus marinus str. MIT 9313]